MRNYLSDGAVVTRTAPVGGLVSGQPFILGSEFLVAMADAAAGTEVACVRRGKVRIPAQSGDVFAQSGKVYFNATSGECEAADAADNVLIGTAEGNQAGGTVDVVLNGASLASAAGDLEAKANKADLASTANGEGASLIGLEDPEDLYTAETVEGALAEVKAIADAAATDADLTALEDDLVHLLAPVIDSWDPTDIGAGVVDPPGVGRYLAVASEVPYVVQRIYDWDGATASETTGDNGDLFFHIGDNVYKRFDGAQWYTVYDAASLLDVVGDTGTGGTAGLVPAPAAGDAAAGKFLKADGSWETPPAGGLTDVKPSDLAALEGDGFKIPLVIATHINAGVGGNPDDLTIYAVDSLPFPFVVFKYEALWSAGTGVGVTAEVRTAAAGAGTLLATIDASTSDAASLIADPDVVVPGETVGLFLRRSDDALTGLVLLHCLKVESGV